MSHPDDDDDDIQCSGKASSIFTRPKNDKKLARRIFSPIQQIIQFDQHEIANHYKDFKRKRINRERRRRQSSSPAAKYLGSHQKNRLALTSTREILRMPCFAFPRFGKNFPWRGRQTPCNQNTTKIESETLQKISSAVTVSDFHKLFIQTYNLSTSSSSSSTTGSGSACISNEKHSYNNPLTCHIEKGKVLSNRKPVTSTVHIITNNNNNNNNHRNNRKGRVRYNITTKVGGNETTFDDETENVEWYIELASRCYSEGFQWHMNYLNDCKRRSALLKRRRLTGTVSKSIRQCAVVGQCAEHETHPAAGNNIEQKILNDDRFREDVSDCKIRININQSLNSNSNHTTKTINHNTRSSSSNSITSNTRKRSNYSYVAHLNKKINIMNIDATNVVQNDMKTDRLNEVLDNFGSLNISCGGSVLPQIVLTDFSSADSMPRTNILLLTPSSSSSSSEQFNISGTQSSQSQTEGLSIIPAEYYRNETRPSC